MPTIDIHDFYPHPLKMRYGGLIAPHNRIKWVLDCNKNEYQKTLASFGEIADPLLDISFHKSNDFDPYWENGFFPMLDTIALFGLLASHPPRRYIEIGSGNSTKVAHFAKKSLSLDFEITSIDPSPRAEINTLCDKVLRKPLQDCDLALFENLQPGDILFFDGSHRVLQNSDNEVLFFEIIPRLKQGVLIHLHDINWPDDYPDEWSNRYYNEQYTLGAMLLYAPELFQVVFPAAYISREISYDATLGKFWKRDGFEKMQKHGCSFWFRKINTNAALNAT
jgi:hypothetical protein